MISRTIETWARKNTGWFPVVSITGPRQSGKSTLVRSAFPEYAYVNLEDATARQMALDDPVGFIRNRPRRLAVDEAQLAPELFNMIQVVSDETGEPGQYILSGSQNFLLLKQITQSLAGRVALLRLLPLSYREALSADSELTVSDFCLRGGYPRLYDIEIPPSVYFDYYVDTYLTRDVSGYVDPRNLATFRAFLAVCAVTCGGLLNVTSLANAVGVSTKTARSWLSVLQSSHILFELPPYHANLRKRLTRTPKLYFYDTGLLCHLLGIKSGEQLDGSKARGAVYEDLVISETMKRHLNAGRNPSLFFYRDDSKIEVDLVDTTDPAHPELVEIKSSATYRATFMRHLPSVGESLGIRSDGQAVVMQSETTETVHDRRVWAMRDWLLRE